MSKEGFCRTQVEAVAFLQAQGFKISKSKFNRDVKSGYISKGEDGFSHADLLAYMQDDAWPLVPDPVSTGDDTGDAGQAQARGFIYFGVSPDDEESDEAEAGDIYAAGGWPEDREGNQACAIVVQGDSGSTYAVSFVEGRKGLAMHCSCPAGFNGQICKHRRRLLNGDVTQVIQAGEKAKELLQQIARNPLILSIMEHELTVEKQIAALKREASQLKKQLGRVLEEGILRNKENSI